MHISFSNLTFVTIFVTICILNRAPVVLVCMERNDCFMVQIPNPNPEHFGPSSPVGKKRLVHAISRESIPFLLFCDETLPKSLPRSRFLN